MSIPLLSIGIPTYNRAEYLIQCLNSFVSQLDKDAGIVEIVISDNASTDKTKEVVDEYRHKHSYIRYSRNLTNIGAEANIFAVAKLAIGKWLWVFGDDDIILEGGLNKVLAQITNGGFDFILANKTVKNKDFTATLIKNQNVGCATSAFFNIKDLCAGFGLFTQLGFISTAIFRRQPFVAINPEPYLALHNCYTEAGVLLEAFDNKPCLYLSDIVVCQRQLAGDGLTALWPYISSSGIIRMFKLLAEHGVNDYGLIERIRENPFNERPRSLADIILETCEKYQVPIDDLNDLKQMFSTFKSRYYRKQLGRIMRANKWHGKLLEALNHVVMELLGWRHYSVSVIDTLAGAFRPYLGWAYPILRPVRNLFKRGRV